MLKHCHGQLAFVQINAMNLICVDSGGCVETTTVKTEKGTQRWSTESIRRDELFLKLLGVRS